MLGEFGGAARPDDEAQLQDLHDASTAFAAELADAGAFAAAGKASNLGALKRNIEELLGEVRDVAAECASGRFDDAAMDTAAAREALSALGERVRPTRSLFHTSMYTDIQVPGRAVATVPAMPVSGNICESCGGRAVCGVRGARRELREDRQALRRAAARLCGRL